MDFDKNKDAGLLFLAIFPATALSQCFQLSTAIALANSDKPAFSVSIFTTACLSLLVFCYPMPRSSMRGIQDVRSTYTSRLLLLLLLTSISIALSPS